MCKWLNPRWPPSSSWVSMNNFESVWISCSQTFEQNGWIKDGQNSKWQNIQDGCQHLFKSEWMSLTQIKLVSVRIWMEWRVFLSESERRKQGVWIQDGSVWIQHGQNSQMDSIIKLIQNDWVKFFCGKWLNPRWPPSSSWVRMNDFESDWISWSQSFEQNGWIQDIRI